MDSFKEERDIAQRTITFDKVEMVGTDPTLWPVHYTIRINWNNRVDSIQGLSILGQEIEIV